MCLDTIYRGKQKKEALAKLPESGYYWKVVETYPPDRNYYPPCYGHKPYKVGQNATSRLYGRDYVIAYHIFRSQRAALSYTRIFSPTRRVPNMKAIRCKVNKKDIINIGIQNNGLCIVTTRFWCPKPKT